MGWRLAQFHCRTMRRGSGKVKAGILAVGGYKTPKCSAGAIKKRIRKIPDTQNENSPLV